MRHIRSIRKKLLMSLVLLACMMCLAGPVHASAASTNVVATAKTVSGGKWVGRKYRLPGGRYAKSTWLKIGGSIYRFSSGGTRVTGWISYRGQKYYAASNGKLYVKKWLKRNGRYYYLQSNGTLARKKMVTSGKKTYYVNASGIRVKSTWVTYKKKRYYFNKSGVRLQKTWLKYKGKYYYLNADGTKAVNRWVGSYYVGSTGARRTNCVIDGYYLGANGKRTVKRFDGKYIFVGDSRMVGMESSNPSKDALYIAKVGSGYSWLKSTAGPKLKAYLTLNPNVKVVLAFGTNDLGNISLYTSYYRSLIRQFPRTKFTVLSVNPVEEAVGAKHGYTIKNKQIVAFDKKLREAFGAAYVNTYKFVKERIKGNTIDGVHYSAQLYQELYRHLLTVLG